MAGDPIGTITITPLDPAGAPVTMTTDPVAVEKWDPDKSVEAGLAGASTTYDFGQFANRAMRTLTWGGSGQWLDRDTVLTIRQWLGVAGSTYRYQDDEGNDWTVELLAFQAVRDFADLYKCTLEVHVLAMDQYLGQSYAGV